VRETGIWTKRNCICTTDKERISAVTYRVDHIVRSSSHRHLVNRSRGVNLGSRWDVLAHSSLVRIELFSSATHNYRSDHLASQGFPRSPSFPIAAFFRKRNCHYWEHLMRLVSLLKNSAKGDNEAQGKEKKFTASLIGGFLRAPQTEVAFPPKRRKG